MPALADLSEALKLYPPDSETYFLRATAYLGKKNPHKALDDLNKTLELNPKYS